METKHALSIRNKIVGALVRRARLQAGMTQSECAEVLGISRSAFARYERGDRGVSLPQLEVLAYVLDVPLHALWNEDSELTGRAVDADVLPLDRIQQLRTKIIAVQLRKARESVGLSVEDLARTLDCPERVMTEYELGKREMSVAELESAARECGLILEDLINDDTRPVSEAERERKVLARVAELPPEVREFVLNPTNDLYLRIGMKLNSLDADTLRRIAETILDITY
jgi:transcriptional regulator with XRE-family HTH domain